MWWFAGFVVQLDAISSNGGDVVVVLFLLFSNLP